MKSSRVARSPPFFRFLPQDRINSKDAKTCRGEVLSSAGVLCSYLLFLSVPDHHAAEPLFRGKAKNRDPDEDPGKGDGKRDALSWKRRSPSPQLPCPFWLRTVFSDLCLQKVLAHLLSLPLSYTPAGYLSNQREQSIHWGTV